MIQYSWLLSFAVIFILLGYTMYLRQLITKQQKKQLIRERLCCISKRLLDKQIEEIVETKDERVAEEIAKFIKDCLIYNITKGTMNRYDIHKADRCLKNEFDQMLVEEKLSEYCLEEREKWWKKFR